MARIKCMNNKEKTKQDELTLIIIELISKLLDNLCLFDSLSQSASVSLFGSLSSALYMLFSLYSTWEKFQRL